MTGENVLSNVDNPLFELSADQVEIRDQAEKFFMSELHPHQQRMDEATTILDEINTSEFGWREHMLIAKIAIGNGDWEQAHTSLLIATKQRPGLKAAELLLTHVVQKMAQ